MRGRLAPAGMKIPTQRVELGSTVTYAMQNPDTGELYDVDIVCMKARDWRTSKERASGEWYDTQYGSIVVAFRVLG